MKKLSIYLAGPMQGYPEFNFPAFHDAAKKLRYFGHEVFSPAEKDIERHAGVDISKGNAKGELTVAVTNHAFSLRDALRDDMVWICNHADAIALLPGWEYSAGSAAEYALAKALKLKFIYIDKCSHGLFIPPSVDFAQDVDVVEELKHAA